MAKLPPSVIGAADDVALGIYHAARPKPANLIPDDQIKGARGRVTSQQVESAIPTALAPVTKGVEVMDSVASYAINADLLANMALPAVAWAATKVKLKSFGEFLSTPSKWLNTKIMKNTPAEHGTVSNVIQEGAFTAMSVAGSYNVILSYYEKRAALREMCAGMMGKKPEDISYSWLMNSSEPPKMIQEARAHILKEHGWREVMQLGGLGLNLRHLIKGGAGSFYLSMLAGFGPQLASSAVDMVMGQSLVELFQPANQAFNVLKNGQPAPRELPQLLVTLLKEASPDIKSRGHIGELVARKLAMQYIEQKVAPVEALRRIETKEITKDIQGVIAAAEAENAAQMKAAAEHRAKQLEHKLHPTTTTHPHSAKHGNHYASRKVVGEHTDRLTQEKNQSVAPGVA